jgi:diguanylate cyclase (GGDEF)-like protein
MPSSTSKPELRDSGWVALVRLVFAGTASTLMLFSLLQFLVGRFLFASFELFAGLLLLLCAWLFPVLRQQLLVVYLLLLGMFSFLLYVIVMEGASPVAFVWIYIIPVLSYLLVGRRGGAALSIPFALLGVFFYLQHYPGELTAAGLIDIMNAILCGALIIVFMHVYEGRRAAAYDELQRMARTDALTGVASRACFEQALAQSIVESERSGNSLVLVTLDVDHFKSVNDRWGHEAGDKALRHICDLLGERLRASDTLGRLGGEEFGVLLRNTGRSDAEPLVELLREQISSNPLDYRNALIELSATFGLAEWPSDGRTVDELYRCVDQRMYRGKDSGRNQVISRGLA